MKTVNMHEAKTQLSKLVDEAVKGEPFVIAKAGKPMVKVTMIDAAEPRRIGFLEGQFNIPEDFDTMFGGDIQAMFEGRPESPARDKP
jgi:prevent-host-death family protein